MPGVGADSQVAPEVLVRRFGTSTLYAPVASTYRYGFSRITGVVATVVYGGFGKLCAGAPCTPENTMFHTPFWPLPMFDVAGEPLLLGVRLHRADDPAVGDVAAAGQAEAGRGEVEVAADVHPAHRRGLRDRPPGRAAAPMKFSAERQKFWVALPPNQPARPR